ncbi:MAG: protein kinase [Phycisphaeraceae bacterium]|nr:protein kinase [Phycisphaeraceae bacterium]
MAFMEPVRKALAGTQTLFRIPLIAKTNRGRRPTRAGVHGILVCALSPRAHTTISSRLGARLAPRAEPHCRVTFFSSTPSCFYLTTGTAPNSLPSLCPLPSRVKAETRVRACELFAKRMQSKQNTNLDSLGRESNRILQSRRSGPCPHAGRSFFVLMAAAESGRFRCFRKAGNAFLMQSSDFAIPRATLDSERFKLVREIFLDAQRFRGAARQAFLSQRCGGDPALQRQVTDLLKYDDSEASVLDKPVIRAIEETSEIPRMRVPREPVGRFKLLQVLGEGASGVTSLAHNPEARNRRAVVKVVHSAFSFSTAEAREVVSRIQVDQRSLALLRQYPSPRLLDAAQLTGGGMFVATDFVPGEPILNYCDRVRASIRARLLLFLDACEAVQAAHQCGVIHGGLAPGNALVRMAGDVPTVTLLDFGIARALHDLLGHRRTWLEMRLNRGAVEYLAPEQVADQPRLTEPGSDVYALGALLYEILVGVAPFDRFALRRAGIGDFSRIIQEQKVLDPVARLSELSDRSDEIAARRSTSSGELFSELNKELGAIPMKALHKAPTNRYSAVSAMAEDIRGYLDGKPVGAAHGLGGRFRRMLDRFRGLDGKSR